MTNISGKKQRDHDEPNGARTAPSLGNERPGLIFESAPVMMHSIDRDGRIVAVNREWLKRLGYERDEVLGRKSIDFLPTPHGHGLSQTPCRFSGRLGLPEVLDTGS